mgnify:CR=1 FL=1
MGYTQHKLKSIFQSRYMERLTEREKEILALLQSEPMISQEELASRLNISRSSAAVHISNLMRKKAILGRGYVFNERTQVVLVGEIYNLVEVQVEDQDLFSHPPARGRITSRWGGSGLVIAERLAAMKVPVLLITAAGMEEGCEPVLASLRRAGVDTRHVFRSDEYSFPRVLRVLKDKKTAVEIHDLEALNLVSDLLAGKDSLFGGAKAVCLSSSLPPDAICYCLEMSREQDFTLFLSAGVDIRSLKVIPNYEGTDFLILDARQLSEITGIRVEGEEGIQKGAMVLQVKGVANVIVLAQEGVFLFAHDDTRLPLLPGQESIPRTMIYNLTAGLIYGVVKGYSFRQSARIGLGALAGTKGR